MNMIITKRTIMMSLMMFLILLFFTTFFILVFIIVIVVCFPTEWDCSTRQGLPRLLVIETPPDDSHRPLPTCAYLSIFASASRYFTVHRSTWQYFQVLYCTSEYLLVPPSTRQYFKYLTQLDLYIWALVGTFWHSLVLLVLEGTRWVFLSPWQYLLAAQAWVLS